LVLSSQLAIKIVSEIEKKNRKENAVSAWSLFFLEPENEPRNSIPAGRPERGVTGQKESFASSTRGQFPERGYCSAGGSGRRDPKAFMGPQIEQLSR
jgi:hypothetical protein